MTDVRIQGSPAANARVKPVDPALAQHARQLLEGRRDGYDTYGVVTPEGDKLILTKSSKKLAPNDHVTINDRPVQVAYVENEANTFGERFKQPFQSKGGKIALGAGALVAMGIAAPFGVILHAGIPLFIIGLGVWGAVGVGVIAAAIAIGGTANALLKSGAKADESVTDGLAKK
ncbi:MAG: hypothetical protein JWM80_4514 [Cyanobacteria bacterium RYN_339]|nr:hypothetical protein [Cyanobacteria bacterium RYN_339]